jgi:hypothetical protein
VVLSQTQHANSRYVSSKHCVDPHSFEETLLDLQIQLGNFGKRVLEWFSPKGQQDMESDNKDHLTATRCTVGKWLKRIKNAEERENGYSKNSIRFVSSGAIIRSLKENPQPGPSAPLHSYQHPNPQG